MAVIVIRIDGVDVTEDVVIERTMFKGLADGQPGTAKVIIDDQEHAYTGDDIRAGMTLELYIDGTREWDGWIFGVSRGWPLQADDTAVPGGVPRFWTIDGFDRNILFQKRFMYRVDDPSDDAGLKIWPVDTTDKEAIEYALANYVDLTGDGLTYSIESVATPGPYEEFTLGYVAAPLGVLFSDASKITGAVFYITPDRVLTYVDDMTVTAPSVLSDTPTAGQTAYRDLNAALDYTQAANQALVWGAGKGSSDPVFAKYTDDDAVSAYGLWQWGDIYVGAWKQQTVNRRARTYVEGSKSHRRGHNEPVPVVSCTVFEPGFRVGQVADFRATVFGYQQNLPIRSSTITFPTKGTAQFDLELTLKIDTPFGVPDLWDFRYPPWDQTEIIQPERGVSTTRQLLIDHYDVPVPTSTEGTYQFISHVVYATLLHLEGDRVKATWALPSDVEEGDLVLIHGHANTIGGGSGAGATVIGDPYGGPPAPTWSPGWTFANRGLVYADFFATGQLKVGRGYSTSEVYCEFDETGDEITVIAAVMIIVKGKAHASVQSPIALSPWDRTASYPNLSGDASVVVGMGFAFSSASYPTNTATIATLSMLGGSVNVSAWSYLGDSYTADHITWLTGIAKGDIGIWDITERWWRISEDFLWVTPGPSIIGHTAWPGGNEYTKIGNASVVSLAPGASAVRISRGASPPYAGGYAVYDGYRYYLDDPNDDWGYGPVEQGQWISDPTPSAPWHGPSDMTFKCSLTKPAAGVAFIELERHLFVPDPDGPLSELDAAGTDLKRVAWLAEHSLTISLDSSGALELDAYNCWDGGSGIHGEVVPDTTSDYVSGTLEYTVYGPWDHNWWWTPLWTGIDSVEFYLRIDETQVENEETGARRYRVKIWKVGEAEPDWMVDDVLPMYKASAYKHRGYASESGWLDQDDFSASYASYVAIEGQSLAPNTADVDAWWANVRDTVGYVMTDVPIYDNTENTEGSFYITAYPYQAGSLSVFYQGIRLRPNIDYIETDPPSGQFRITASKDIASSLLVKYRRSGTVGTSSGGSVYRPAPQMQYGWGTPLDGYNCTFACSAMALDRHTNGAFTAFVGSPRNTPPNHRGFQNDQVGGGDLGDAAAAWANGWNKSFSSYGVTSWSQFVNLINSGRGAILQGLYGALPASKRFSNFSQGHAIYINEQFANGNFWGIDPLYRYPVIYTTAELQAYAEALPWTGSGLVSAAFT